jgi:cytochrome c-type biogenesis protein CcmH/NrfF
MSRASTYAGRPPLRKLDVMWWIVGIGVVLMTLLIVAGVRRRRSGNKENLQLGHTEQSKSIGNYGSHL